MKFHAVITFGLFVIFSISTPAVANESLWQDAITVQPNNKVLAGFSISSPSHKETHQQARKLLLNKQKMSDLLQYPEDISLPLPDGSMIQVQIELDNILPPTLAEKYPLIKTYRVLPNQNLISGRLDINENGFHGMLQMRSGEVVFIDPETTNTNNTRFKSIQSTLTQQYVSYNKHDQTQDHDESYSCGESHKLEALRPIIESTPQYKALANDPNNTANKLSTKGSLLNYRIAISATGEYVEKSGGTIASALSAIATTLSRVNQIYEKDLGIHLTLIENNDLLIYVDAQSDPYNASSAEGLIQQNQNNIDLVIGTENYDIGHLFTTSSGGGLAAIGSVCQASRKALGVSGIANPHNDSFNIDFVAHEIGHQFGATHTFNSIEGSCSGTRTGFTSFEPGSGSSVMSYAGSCGIDSLQSGSDAMFHIGSIEQIRTFTQAHGEVCGTRQSLGNKAPIADAGVDYTIPARTPFELKGNAVDSDGDSLVYGWQQMDAGLSSSLEDKDNGSNALFRAYMPSENTQRSFPVLNSILTHKAINGETLPSQERTLNFKFVVQDGFNAARSDTMKINVKRTGSRFALEQPRAHYVLGKSHTIKWNVAGTDKAPVSCDSVDVSLSTDGGYSFSRKLLENVPNTGKATIYLDTDLPEVYQARLKLKCSNNIFFAVSYRNFRLTLDDIADAKEVGAEANLSDESINKKSNKSSAAGGASNNAFLVLLLVFGIVARRKKDPVKLEGII
ncbi:MAG: zinc-dependent metalloprotease family protein [Cocleimonas sp.]